MAIRQSRGITLGKGTPQRLEGQNGDITIRSSRKGLKLYVKESNKWHSVDLGINLRQIASTVRKLEDEVKRLSTKTNNTPVVDKILLREPGGTSAVAVQNKKGAVSFRSSTDGANAPVDIAKTGTVDSGGTLTEGMPLLVGSATLSRFLSTTNDAKLAISGTGTGVGDIAFQIHNALNPRWNLGMIANDTSKLYISSGSSLADPEITISNTGDLTLKAPNDSSAKILLQSDNSDDAGDDWTITANTNQRLTIGNDIASAGTPASFLTIVPHATASSSSVSVPGSFSATTLDVDGIAKYKHTTFNTAGPTDGIDVSDTTVLEVDTSSNNVVIGGFSGGVAGQILYIVKTDTTNFIQLEHNESPAVGTHQKIFLTSGSDERVVGYGGYTLYCNGTSWFSLSNPTGAADAG
tara:strand:+ start:5973 stop:7196 length:1224 start_codon:yes stop_codon:yes gene_type:complete